MVDFLFIFFGFLLDSDDAADKHFSPFTSETTHLLLAHKVYVPFLSYLCCIQTNYRQNKSER